jgi:hypothetical protein
MSRGVFHIPSKGGFYLVISTCKITLEKIKIVKLRNEITLGVVEEIKKLFWEEGNKTPPDSFIITFNCNVTGVLLNENKNKMERYFD